MNQPQNFKVYQLGFPRVRDAYKQTEEKLPWFPKELLFRAFKAEAELEVWGRRFDRFELIRTFPVAKLSGGPGPKRREGDKQVPEGFYNITNFNPKSRYHLSLRIDYPNAADLHHSDRDNPGGDIYVHGGESSVGCLAMTDSLMREIYVLAVEAKEQGGTLPIHLFPSRNLDPSNPFHRELLPALSHFNETKTLPEIVVSETGEYRIAPTFQKK